MQVVTGGGERVLVEPDRVGVRIHHACGIAHELIVVHGSLGVAGRAPMICQARDGSPVGRRNFERDCNVTVHRLKLRVQKLSVDRIASERMAKPELRNRRRVSGAASVQRPGAGVRPRTQRAGDRRRNPYRVKGFDPRVYAGAAYMQRTYNYLGYPTISGAGFGISKLPDLDTPFSLYASAR